MAGPPDDANKPVPDSGLAKSKGYGPPGPPLDANNPGARPLVDPAIIESFLFGVPGRITNPADIGLRGLIGEEETKRQVGKSANLKSVADLKQLIADGKRELTKLRAGRAAAMSALQALYGKDGSVTADIFETVEATPGESGAGVGTAIVLAKREHDRAFEVCEATKRDLHHWQRCLAEDQERIDGGVFDRPSPREEHLRAAMAEWEPRLAASKRQYVEQHGREPRPRRFLS